jgi:flap endonuclease-1
MGIKNLMKIITRYAPNAISYHKIDHYKNKTLAIDANLMIYKMIFAVRFNGYDLQNEDIIVTHIHSLLQKFKGFIKYNITPIFVFDGINPKIKEKVIEKRKEFHDYMKQKYYKAVTQDEKKKYYFSKSEITYNEIKECMDLMKIFGYNVIESPEEADAQLAELMKHKKVDYIVTDDMDILIFGGDIMLKNFTVSDKKKIQEINLDIFKKETGLDQKKLIDLAILLGCDYCPSIKGIGTIGAYNLIQKYGSLEEIMKHEKISLSYDYVEARKYFNSPPVIDISKMEINKGDIDKGVLIQFLKEHKYKQSYIDKLIATI